MQNGNTAAIYCRLSRDEDTNQESNSIQSQRLMLTDFCNRQGFSIAGEYVEMKTTSLIQFNYSCRNFIFGCIYKSEFAPKRTQCT